MKIKLTPTAKLLKKKLPLKSLNEVLNQPPILEFRGFILRPLDNHTLWFENRDGEGTTLPMDIFEDELNELFRGCF